jgi:hypothetical protein
VLGKEPPPDVSGSSNIEGIPEKRYVPTAYSQPVTRTITSSQTRAPIVSGVSDNNLRKQTNSLRESGSKSTLANLITDESETRKRVEKESSNVMKTKAAVPNPISTGLEQYVKLVPGSACPNILPDITGKKL